MGGHFNAKGFTYSSALLKMSHSSVLITVDEAVTFVKLNAANRNIEDFNKILCEL